ncbi:hypothetical protein VTN77DRAFT_8880 [Rasamsonia byssochlamydoides]|uniref:uncharacterized protein n=1 Tax=Rasamsonia byssochlamydoides TaxID=89139 RepID=UPI0037444011
MSYQTKLFINNEFVSSKSGESFDIYNPADESLVVKGVQAAGPEDVDAAVDAATAAFKTGPWSTYSASKRAELMLKLADLIDANTERLAQLESVAMGQPIFLARMGVSAASAFFRYYAGYADKIPGQVFPEDQDGVYKIVQYGPLGVCAGIAAWNFTFVYVGWKIAPAIAAGNTFIFKSSEKSPLGVLALGELVVEAGFPPGVINFVSGGGSTGQLLASHMKIAKIAFTGSVLVGRKVQEAATKSNLKRVSLELGGKSASLIFEDADLENALTANSQSFLINSGQVCAALSRVFVQETIAPAFIEGLKTRFQTFAHTLGDPLDQKTFLGPLVDRAQFDRVMGFIAEGRKENLNIAVGGNRGRDKGFFVEPTLIVDPPLSSKLYTDEIFGPVLVVKTFKTEEEAVELANDTSYGLGAAVYTKDIARALRVSKKLESGVVGINMVYQIYPQLPFGGVKQSGYGRESGEEGLREYLEMKSIAIKM